MTTEIVTLTDVELDRLHELVAIVHEGATTFVRVGDALAEIRDAHLYRATHKTFDTFVKAEFGFGRAYAYRQIAAADAYNEIALSPVGDIPPDSERAIRPLVGRGPGFASKVWAEARERAGGGRPTSQHVKEALGKRCGYSPPRERHDVERDIVAALADVLRGRDDAELVVANVLLRMIAGTLPEKTYGKNPGWQGERRRFNATVQGYADKFHRELLGDTSQESIETHVVVSQEIEAPAEPAQEPDAKPCPYCQRRGVHADECTRPVLCDVCGYDHRPGAFECEEQRVVTTVTTRGAA